MPGFDNELRALDCNLNDVGVALLTHPVLVQDFVKSLNALYLHVHWDVNVVLLTHALPFQDFGKSLRALDLHVLNDVVVGLADFRLPSARFGMGPKVCMFE